MEETEKLSLWLEVDLNAVAKNLSRIKAEMPGQKIMAVVKANGYGLGMVELARFLEHQVFYLGVSSMEEGIMLRKEGIRAPILILSPYFDPFSVIQYHLTPTVDKKEDLLSLHGTAVLLGRGISYHLKINTGMNRFGIRPQEIPSWIPLIREKREITLEGVYSHFAVTFAQNASFAAHQLKIFQESLSTFKKEGLEIPLVHMANSEMAIDYPESRFNMVRIGNALYGPVATKKRIGLARVYQLKGRVLEIIQVPKGEYVGYGASFRANQRMRLAVLPYGTKDGYGWIRSRVEGNWREKVKGFLRLFYHAFFPPPIFFYQGRPLKVVGKPFMNFVLVDVTREEEVKRGSILLIKPSSILTVSEQVERYYIGKRKEEENELYRERGKVQV
ncbi:putative Alanine racemase 2 [[Clostridium] ultunense Esp]|nr:putative Alanine racemase 2 [[Clostridium] ultunense Esp]